MRLALTWWGWAGLVVAVVIILGLWARRAWRAAVRLELLDHLDRELPDLRITRVHADRLIVTVTGSGRAVQTAFPLHGFYDGLAQCPSDRTAEAEAARLEVFRMAVVTLRDATVAQSDHRAGIDHAA
jgi:hypothetical protein